VIQVQACDNVGFGETMASSRVLRADLGEDFANDLCDPILRQLHVVQVQETLSPYTLTKWLKVNRLGSSAKWSTNS
jgi:hypothetical protein